MKAYAQKSGLTDSSVVTAAYSVSAVPTTNALREYIRVGGQPVAIENTSAAAPILVTVLPPTVNLGTGGGNGFYTLVSNSCNQGVTWSTDLGSICNAVGSGCPAAGWYTAPSTTVLGTTAHVTAMSVADPTKSGTATVNILPTSVTVSPNYVSLTTGGAQQFGASVSNQANQSVTWGLNAPPYANGTISSNGYFQSTAGLTSTAYAAIYAASVVTPLASGTAVAQINPAVPSVTYVSPTGSTSNPVTFSIAVNGVVSPVYEVLLFLNSSLGATGGCLVYYRTTDNGLAYGQAVPSGQNPWASSPYCTISVGGSPFSASGNAGTLTLTAAFTSAWAGTYQNIYAWVSNQASANSGWQPMGWWGIP